MNHENLVARQAFGGLKLGSLALWPNQGLTVYYGKKTPAGNLGTGPRPQWPKYPSTRFKPSLGFLK